MKICRGRADEGGVVAPAVLADLKFERQEAPCRKQEADHVRKGGLVEGRGRVVSVAIDRIPAAMRSMERAMLACPRSPSRKMSVTVCSLYPEDSL